MKTEEPKCTCRDLGPHERGCPFWAKPSQSPTLTAMARPHTLTREERALLPLTDFAIPTRRAYPIPDEHHARLALDDSQAADAHDRALVRGAVSKRYPRLLAQWDLEHPTIDTGRQ